MCTGECARARVCERESACVSAQEREREREEKERESVHVRACACTCVCVSVCVVLLHWPGGGGDSRAPIPWVCDDSSHEYAMLAGCYPLYLN